MTIVKSIAVLITCFNRKDITLKCLKVLFSLNINLDVYLVDDNSNDLTSLAIKEEFPKVRIFSGNGNLFWNRGMHLAWSKASEHMYDYYLWLNDDVTLYPDSLLELLECSRLSNDSAIISGIIGSETSDSILYGGCDKNGLLLSPNGKMQSIFHMNGNCVLIPRYVFSELGNLDIKFHHDLGDVDYGLRALKNKINVFTSRKVVGSCIKNNLCRVRLPNVNIFQRFSKLYSPLGNHPRINFYFRLKHRGLFNAFFYFIYLHFINITSDKLNKFIFGNKYFPD